MASGTLTLQSSEFMSLNGLPENWEVKKLGDVCFTTSGGTPSRKKPSFYRGNIPWVKSGELDKGLIFGTEEKITRFHHGAELGKEAIDVNRGSVRGGAV